MILGRFTDIPSWLGRDGIHTLESGLGGPTSHLGSASESGGGVVLGGDGVIGDSIGIITRFCLTTADTLPAAPRFITGTISIAAEKPVAEFSIIQVRPPGRSAETTGPPGDTLSPVAKVASARAPSAASSVADRPGAFRPAEAPASEESPTVAVDFMAVVAGAANRRVGSFD